MKAATIHLVIVDGNENGDKNTVDLKKLEEKYPGFTEQLSRGDIIEDISEHGYRSQGVWFWDGQSIIPQDIEDDPYGMVPKEFKLGEFPPGYWDTDSEHTVVGWETGSATEFYWHVDPPPIAFNAEKYCPILDNIDEISVQILGIGYPLLINSVEKFNYDQHSNGYVMVYWNKESGQLVYEVC